ncbi:seryl-tRNA synthetase [Mortierella sp. GBA30]|nr:seryl-tRNA synthetase [Mortierella sp. GBA30]
MQRFVKASVGRFESIASRPRSAVPGRTSILLTRPCCHQYQYQQRLHISTSTSSYSSAPSQANSPSQPVPALILKPYINFKHLAQPENAAAMAANVKNRNLPDSISVAAVNELHATVAERTQQLDRSRAERNRIAAEMKSLFSGGGASKGKKKQPKLMTEQAAAEEMSKEAKEAKRQDLVERGRVLKEHIHAQEAELTHLEAQLYDQAVMIPNSTHPSSPIGPESEATLVRIQGVPRLNAGVKAFAHPGFEKVQLIGGEEGRALLGNVSHYPLLDHVTLSRNLDLIDLESATAVTGSRWYYLKNEAALLELALIQYATQRAVKAGFTPVITPDVVRPEVVQACGFQPRDEASQTYWVSTVAPGSNRANTAECAQQHQHSALCLVATAEISLAGMNLNKVLDESQLPIKMAGFGRAFRAEAGSRGAEVKGLYRVHQFSKVELFVLSKADSGESDRILEELRQVLDMPTEELGASAYKKYDIEAWMPGRNGWGEISSTSNCTDYQSRRLNIRYRTNKIVPRFTAPDAHSATPPSVASDDLDFHHQKQVTLAQPTSNSTTTTEFVHTLNGTAVAVPRLIVALLETYQQEDGSVRLPECLWPFMAGIQEIRPKANLASRCIKV